MVVLKQVKLDDAHNIIFTQLYDELELWEIPETVANGMIFSANSIITKYEAMGCHLIGRWKYDTESEEYPDLETVLQSMVSERVAKYYPYLKVLANEFSAITGVENQRIDYEQEDNSTETNAVTNEKTKEDSKSESGSRNREYSDSGSIAKDKSETTNNYTFGSNVSAHEESPIDNASITFPASITHDGWPLGAPNKKDGESFEHNASLSGTVDEDTTESKSGEEDETTSASGTYSSSTNESETANKQGTNNMEGNKRITIENPEMLLKVLRFNVNELNLTKIAEMFVNSFIEEKTVIY